MKKQDIEFEIIQDFFVSIVLTITAGLLGGGIGKPGVLAADILFAWIVNMLIGFLIPEKKIGGKLIDALKLNQSKAAFFVMMLVIVVINVLGISACAVLKNVGFSVQFWSIWPKLLPVLMLVGYIAAIVFYPISNVIVKMINK